MGLEQWDEISFEVNNQIFDYYVSGLFSGYFSFNVWGKNHNYPSKQSLCLKMKSFETFKVNW